MSALLPSKHIAAVGIVAVCVLTMAASPADAGAGDAMVAHAAAAYKKGDYVRASELFENAWQLQTGNTRLLYNAARTAQLAGKPERAESLYRRFMKLPKRDAKAEVKARDYLQVLDVRRAESKAEQARKAAEAGKHGTAALLWAAAARLAPDRHMYVFRAGQEAMLGGDKAEAKAHLQRYLKTAPADATDRPEAKAYLAKLNRPTPVVKPAVPPSKQAPVAVAVKKPEPVSHTMEYTLVGGGVLLGLISAWQYFEAEGAAEELRDQFKQTNAGGQIIGISWADAESENETIAVQRTIAAASGVIGGVALAAGLVMRLTADDPAQGAKKATSIELVPRRNGAGMVVRF